MLFIAYTVYIIAVSACFVIVLCLTLQAIVLIALALTMIGIDPAPILNIATPDRIVRVVGFIVDNIVDNVGQVHLRDAQELADQEQAAKELAAKEFAAKELAAKERAIQEFKTKELAAKSSKSPPKV
jgi:hypothetical protein